MEKSRGFSRNCTFVTDFSLKLDADRDSKIFIKQFQAKHKTYCSRGILYCKTLQMELFWWDLCCLNSSYQIPALYGWHLIFLGVNITHTVVSRYWVWLLLMLQRQESEDVISSLESSLVTLTRIVVRRSIATTTSRRTGVAAWSPTRWPSVSAPTSAAPSSLSREPSDLFVLTEENTRKQWRMWRGVAEKVTIGDKKLLNNFPTKKIFNQNKTVPFYFSLSRN